jgi:hypothetical protein
LEEEEDIALSELGSEEERLRRQRAHDVARTFESLHLEGSDVDPETMAIAQRYVWSSKALSVPYGASVENRCEYGPRRAQRGTDKSAGRHR